MSNTSPFPDPTADLRAEIARRQIALYVLAPQVGLHPSHLGQVLRGRRALSPELARRIHDALNHGAWRDTAVVDADHEPVASAS